jgi:RNA polymerase sigma factor (sigma-70 family)
MIDAIRRLDLRSRDETRLAVRHAAGDLEEGAQTERAKRAAARRLVSADHSPTDSEPMVARLKDSMAPAVDELAGQSEQQQKLMEALGALAPRQREAIELGLFEGMALREIGAQMGISESRVCQLQKRAVVHLRTAVNEPVAA